MPNFAAPLCQHIGCTRKASALRTRDDGYLACGWHRRSKAKDFIPTHTMGNHSGGFSALHMGHKARLAPKDNWRTYETASPVVIKNPVNWCAVCKAPISAAYTWCKDCLHAQDYDTQRAEYRRLKDRAGRARLGSNWHSKLP